MSEVFFRNPHLLKTERLEDFQALQNEFIEDIGPRNSIERMYVADMAHHHWQTLRWRRCKAALINTEMAQVILRALNIWGIGGAISLSQKWATDPEARSAVANHFAQRGLDESTIEAKAIVRFLEEFEALDKALMLSETAFGRAFRAIEDYRSGFAKPVRSDSERILRSKQSPLLENLPS